MPRRSTRLAALLAVVPLAASLRRGSQSKGMQPTAACPHPEKLAKGYACACTGGSECGTFETPSVAAGSSLVVKSVRNKGFFMTETRQVEREAKFPSGIRKAKIQVQAEKGAGKHPIDGFGGAFTDAMAFHYANMDAATKEAFIELQFGKTGIGYNMGRTHMGASDFSRMDYVLVNQTDDYDLDSFCLRDDTAKEVPCGSDYKIPPILAAQEALQNQNHPELKLFVSMWSPPLWVKDQRMACEMKHGIAACKPDPTREPIVECKASVSVPCDKNPLKERCEQSDGSVFNNPRYPGINPGVNRTTWAEDIITHNALGNCYYAGMMSSETKKMQALADMYKRFIQEYAKRGVSMWGMTVQNEPLKQDGLWNAMFWTAELQAQFMREALGPTMREAFPELKLIIHDDTTLELPLFAKHILDDPAAAQYVDGVGFHWYHAIQGLYENSGAQVPLGFVGDVANIPEVGGGEYVRTVGEAYPDKFFFMSEACNGYLLDQGEFQGPSPGNWGYGYSYSHDIMWQLKNGATAWVDWNLVLDMEGGPNHNGNQVDAPTLMRDASTFYLNPSFYHMAHFSRFLPRGSRALRTTTPKCNLRHTCENVAAFVTPVDAASYPNSLVFVITNDEITEAPNYAGGAGVVAYPALAKGQGSLNTGAIATKDVFYSVGCDRHGWVEGQVEWKGIDTIVIPCGDAPCNC